VRLAGPAAAGRNSARSLIRPSSIPFTFAWGHWWADIREYTVLCLLFCSGHRMYYPHGNRSVVMCTGCTICRKRYRCYHAMLRSYHGSINVLMPRHLHLHNGATTYCIVHSLSRSKLLQLRWRKEQRYTTYTCNACCEKLNPNRDAVQQAAHDMVCNSAGVPKGQNFHVYVELHWPGNAAHVIWRTMVGYVTSDNSYATALCTYLWHCCTALHIFSLTLLMSTQWQVEQEVSRPDSRLFLV
jgi:hypothetical protein